ncbi:MAG: crossover junction endodeoxyribonuclease RuvC [Clostridiales bacterium]|nr:crossover junction endodeoxyribonuclease RuvC [Clostridiales bacterium]
MRILGIDPGYAIVGYGILDYEGNKFSVVDYGAILTQAGEPFNERLEYIYDELCALMEKYKPQFMSIEKLFYNTNAKTVIDVAQARGVTMLAAQKHNLSVYEYTPLQVKQSVVGYGRAEKKQVQQMTATILNLEAVPKPDDTADAIAMAICHAHSSGSSLGNIYSSKPNLKNLKIRNGI